MSIITIRPPRTLSAVSLVLFPGIILERDGGALYLQTYCSANFTRCHFTDNQAQDDGGAMFVDRHSFLLLSRCEFGNNRAADSGGAFVIQGSDAQVNDSSFDSNYVRYGYGGSICTLQSDTTTVSGSTFSNGSSGIGGAISILSQTDFMISDSVISRCRSAVMGGRGVCPRNFIHGAQFCCD